MFITRHGSNGHGLAEAASVLQGQPTALSLWEHANGNYEAAREAWRREEALQAAGLPYSEAVIASARAYLGLTPKPPQVSFIERSQPKED